MKSCEKRRLTLPPHTPPSHTHIDIRRAADNALHFAAMHSKGMHQHARIQVPKFDCKIRPSRDKMVTVVCPAVGVGMEEGTHSALVSLQDTVLRPT